MKQEKQGSKQARTGKKDFVGLWHIVKMSTWDKDYFNMEVRAYIKVEKSRSGEFQFGLVTGSIDGEFKKTAEGLVFDFTWAGSDECDEESGDGWMRISKDGTAEGELRIHNGDNSLFWAKKKK